VVKKFNSTTNSNTGAMAATPKGNDLCKDTSYNVHIVTYVV